LRAIGRRGMAHAALLLRDERFGMSTSGTRPTPYRFFVASTFTISRAIVSAAATSFASKFFFPALSRRSMKPIMRRPRPNIGTATSRSLLWRNSTSAIRSSSAKLLIMTGECAVVRRCTSESFASTMRRSAGLNAYDVTIS
jgi:hypothetical protein